MSLSNLKPAKGSTKKKWIIGRGMGSGSGRNCGYGHKGAKSREGRGKGYGSGYEGGQTRFYQRLPKIRGWRNQDVNPIKTAEIRLARLNIIAEGTDVDLFVLKSLGLVNKTDEAYKILGGGELKVKLNFKGARATKASIDAIQKLGGTIELAGLSTKGE